MDFKMKNMEEKILKLIGPRIKALRKAKNLSQQAGSLYILLLIKFNPGAIILLL
jgi:hypothetical protein